MTHAHRPPSRPSSRSSAALAAAALGLATLAGCSGGGSGGSTLFTPFSTKQGVAGSTPIVISERWLLFLADEATTGPTGTDMNGDSDKIDSIATLVNMATKKETRLDVAAQELFVVGTDVYLVVSEASDGFDWDGDASTDDFVLLHTSATTATATSAAYVDTLESSGDVHALVVDGRLYYVSEPILPLANGESSLSFIDPSVDPTVPTTVAHTDAANTLDPRILGADEDLIFLYQDETVEGRNLNGTLGLPLDVDSTDGFVLALLDGGDPAAMIQNVELALEGDDPVFRAKSRSAGDWLVAFLVDETAQGAQNLNDPLTFPPTWQPDQCLGFEDADTLDQSLFFLEFALWQTDRVANPPRNTGLVGHDRVFAVSAASSPGFVGTISRESDEGTCSLNNSSGSDTDTTDDVLRWVEAEVPILPFKSAAQLVALEDVPGGTRGVTDFANRFVIVVDEDDDNRDHDGVPAVDNDLAAWLDPGDGAAASWTFDHNGAVTPGGPVGVTWMAERAQRDRVLVAFQESVFGASVNFGGDSDTLDSSPTFVRFDPNDPDDLDFSGPAIACDADNAGTAIGNGVGLYRVDEAADNRDWNQDGVKDDFVLFRTTVATLQNSVFLSTLNDLVRPAVETTGNVGAAFIADEAIANKDLNTDGDQNDLVLRWLRIGP